MGTTTFVRKKKDDKIEAKFANAQELGAPKARYQSLRKQMISMHGHHMHHVIPKVLVGPPARLDWFDPCPLVETNLTEYRDRIAHLERELQILRRQALMDKPHVYLYRLGAGLLFVSCLSLLMWYFTGVAVPFHPIFAGVTIPISIFIVVMAFFVRSIVAHRNFHEQQMRERFWNG